MTPNKLLKPICFFADHDDALEKPNEHLIKCRRCGTDTTVPFFKRIKRLPWRTALALVWLANKIAEGRHPTHDPVFRPVDHYMPGIGTEHSCGAYSYEHIASLIKQYKDDGLPEPLLKDLISEDGWVNLEDNPELARQVIDDLSREATLESTRREQEELNRDKEGE